MLSKYFFNRPPPVKLLPPLPLLQRLPLPLPPLQLPPMLPRAARRLTDSTVHLPVAGAQTAQCLYDFYLNGQCLIYI